MNQTIDVIQRRKSTRGFKQQPLLDYEKTTILQAVFRAPTAGNMMLYSIIEVADQELKDRLVETCDHQPFIARAPFVLLFLADYQRWMDYYRLSGARDLCERQDLQYRTPKEGDLLLACCDTLIAAQNAVIAAESMGIGSCYIGDIMENYEIHREMFHLPKYVLPITLLCFGYPARDAEERPRTSRFEPEFVYFQDRYNRLDDESLIRMFQPSQDRVFAGGRSIRGAENFGQHEFLRKFIADFSIEMNRSVRAMISSWCDEEN